MSKKKKSLAKATKKILAPIIEEAKKMPPRHGRTYTANMDNVIFEAKFVPGSDKDEHGKYNPPHLREVSSNVVLSVGPIVNNPAMKKNAKIIPMNISKITILEMDEEGYIGSIKPHDVIAIVK